MEPRRRHRASPSRRTQRYPHRRGQRAPVRALRGARAPRKKEEMRLCLSPPKGASLLPPVHACPLLALPTHSADHEEGQRPSETVKYQGPRRRTKRPIGLLTTHYSLLMATLSYLLDIGCLPPPHHTTRIEKKESL
ncbi:hypothetical protein NDU88_003445 [Pleurodeles waltl]|uniref:Uncharacterized protein n=1 Tax=Pleurodeles waltl TaxID=8319 RepID=A0AAV7RGM1_PLEWA|nr:hypothetical protein NDU88_003445 [Pleurodeles waltl]